MNPELSTGPTFDETVTRRDTVSSPPTVTLSPTSLHNANQFIETSNLIKTNDLSSKAVSEIVSRSMRNEKTEDLNDSFQALEDLRCLIEFMDVELRPVTTSFQGNTRQKVAFSDMWHLFKPGELLHSPVGNQPTDHYYRDARGDSYRLKPNDRFQEAWRVACTAGGRPCLAPVDGDRKTTGHNTPTNAFKISAYRMDFNGTQFVSQTFLFSIAPFPGERDITSLQCYPLRYSPKADELKSKWKTRGEAFCEYTTFKYRHYTGKTLTCAPDGIYLPGDTYPKHAEAIDSHVVVDFGEALTAHPGWKGLTHDYMLGLEHYPGEFLEDYPTCYWIDGNFNESHDDIYEDMHIDIKLMEEHIARDPLLREDPHTLLTGIFEWNENHLVLLPNRVFAFVMKNRKWCKYCCQ